MCMSGNEMYERYQDRDCIMHLWKRSKEVWYGLLVDAGSDEEASAAKRDLDAILKREGLSLADREGSFVFCSAAYTKDVLEELRSYMRGRIDEPIFIEGKYEKLLGSFWAEDLIRKLTSVEDKP